jgi:cell division septation protein DedD
MDAKQRRDQALNLAEFKIDDILSMPVDRLLAEVAEDHGQPTRLAAAFDAIASPLLSSHDSGAVRQGGALAITLPQAAPDAASLAAASPPSPAAWSRRRAALATLSGSLAVPLRHRVALGACAALLLVAVLAPGIYPRLSSPRLFSPPAEPTAGPSAEATAPKDEPTTPLPGTTPPQPQRAPNEAALRDDLSSSRGQLPSARSPTPPPAAPPPDAAPPAPTEARQAAPPASAASRAAAPRPMAAAEAPAAAPAQAPLQRQAAAPARASEGFVVQLAAAKSEAQARATFRTLRSRYAVLQGREPVVRRKEAGKDGVSYAVQVGPFESQAEAEGLCGQLKAAGGSCFTTKN